MKYKYILLILSLILSFASFSQSKKTVKADKLFDRFKYQEAIKEYKKILRHDRKDAEYIYKKLGDAYAIISQPEDAEIWYEKAVYDASSEPIYYYKYAMALRQNKKYQASVKWMNIYKEHSGLSDSRLEEFFKELDIVEKVKREGMKAQLYGLSLNSKYTEYGGTFYGQDTIVYTTNNINAKGKRVSSYDNLPFTDLETGIYATDDSDDDDYVKGTGFSQNINTNFHESSPTFNKDFNVLYFTRNNLNPTKRNKLIDFNLKIYRSLKNEDGSWSKPEEVHFDSDTYNCAHPCLSPDNKTLYFVSDMPGSLGKSDIYKVSVNPDWTLGEPVNMGKDINTEGVETFPFIDAHNNLFFSSDGHAGLGGLDIFVAFYVNNQFFMLKNLGLPYNSSKDDFAFIINSTDKEGFISSNRLGGQGSDDIYLFKTKEKFKPLIYFVGHTKDDNGYVIPNTKLQLYSAGKQVAQNISYFDGRFTFLVDPAKEYEIKAQKKGFDPVSYKFDTYNLKTSKIKKDLILQAQQKVKVCVADYDTKKALDSVQVKIYGHNGHDERFILYTKPNGCLEFEVPVDKRHQQVLYEFEFRKSLYLPKRYNYQQKLERDTLNWIKPNKERILMVKLSLKPIYFDLDKAEIRPDAALELDKIVTLLKTHPKLRLSMESHTDSRQTKAYNLELSNRRAKATMQYLIDHGIDASRLEAKGFGESRLVNDCSDGVKCSEKEHQMNRRTEFVIINE